jgi:pilus assembly protein FimV
MAKERERSERRLEKRMPQQIVTRQLARWIAGTFLALCPLVSHALGLGKLDVKSALNQPLDAEIDFTSITQSELKGLKVSLAPRADFEAAGAERLPLLSRIKFTVSKRPDGRYYLQLKSDAPIEEPFLHMLLQVEWAGGRLVREYTALIDPPSYVAARPSAVESPRAAPPVAAPMAQPVPEVETVPPPTPSDSESQTQIATPAPPMAEPLAAARPAEPQPAPAPRAGETQEVAIPTPSSGSQQATVVGQGSDWANAVEYTVRPGDTLWSIAQRIRADKQLSLEQVILAIFRNNPDAFFRNNVNNVYAGKVLKIPERDAVEASPIREARREFRAQYSAWKEYKLQLAERSQTLKVDAEPAESAPAAKQAEAQEAKQEPAAKPEKGASATDETAKQSEELLKIVRATGDSKDQTAGEKSAETESAKSAESRERTALAERVTTLDESLESKRLENRELTEKVGQVRSQIKNEKRLIELENQALAQQTAKPEPAKPEAAKPDAAAKSEPAAPAPMPEKKAEAAAKPSPKPAAPPAKPVKTAPRRPVRAAVPPPPEKGLVATVMDMALDPSLLPVIGGVIVLGGAILLLYMRRRRRSIAEFEESILASDAIATEAQPTSAETTTGQVTTGDTSFLSDFSKGGMGQVHTDEVDPVAEAEVYLAYGRDETAEEILKEAIVKNPERHELKQKLLEIYHQRNDVNAFETLAEELYASVGGRGGKIWEKVEEMGRKLNPENPMFRGGAAPDRRTADASAATMPATGSGEMSAAGAGAMGAAAATQVVDAPPSVDFDFNAGESDMSTDSSVEFDLNTGDMAPQSPPEEKPVEGAASGGLDELEGLTLDAPADNVIDFQSEKANASAASDSISFEVDTAPAADGDDIKWEIDTAESTAPATVAVDATETERKPESGNGADEHWDETATKLDLAKAYIDMGDAEGARSILDEVLAEGNDQQKKQAAELAAQIA